MPRSHHHTQSLPDRLSELRRFSVESEPTRIIGSYYARSVDSRTAIRRLEHTTAQGILWAGEIALEQAHKAADNSKASESLSYAQAMFARAKKIGELASRLSIDHVTARAQVQSVHLPVQALLVLEDRLPPRPLAEKVYQRTVNIGYSLALEHRANVHGANRIELNDMLGVTGELAVLSLLERVSLRAIGTESWFPLLSLASEDHRNKHGSSLNHGWDISIFTDREDSPITDYRIQVKASNGKPPSLVRPDETGISLVSIHPDLKIKPDEYHIPSRVIEECFTELNDPAHSALASANLDERTEKLLEKIDS